MNNQYRLYTQHKPNVHILISWIDRHCSECGKFLKKTNTTSICHYCSLKRLSEGYYNKNSKPYRPSKEEHAREMRIWRKNNPEKNHEARLREYKRR